MIVSVFVRRLKPGATFQDFVREWEADEMVVAMVEVNAAWT
jgi:hypothetical protein